MYENCEQVLLKATLGNLSHKMSTNCVSSTQSLTLKPNEFCYLHWQSPNSFRQGEGVADTLHKVVDFLKKIWSLIPEVMSLVKIILVKPATNASSVHAFSLLRRMKSYLHTMMSNNRLIIL